MGAARVLAGVVAQFEELLDVGVPRLQVHAGRALAAPALVDGGDGRVQVRSHGTMPFEWPLVPRISEPRDRTFVHEIPMPPAYLLSRAT